MALLIGQYTASIYKQVLVAAVPDRIILVTRLCFSLGGNGLVTLLSDPNGGSEATVTPMWYLLANTVIDVRFGKRYGPAAGRGKALGWTTTVSGSPANHSIMLWYEVVD